ncbi:hypothetical protein BKA62DRAFT_680564 [Auriculariales sp. MPI-PUGE-AT-0066]|nr:hypothetical protein BKA62DRAFT_680564 [Auriculariales sp. MPI-PUGE-AT-0066]
MLAERRILWHPRGDHQFVVGSATQLSLFVWDEVAANISHVASSSDLTGIKCFSWSPLTSCDDLVAVGTDVGRVDLLRLSLSAATASGIGHAVFPSAPVASFVPKGSANASQRACHAIAFSEQDHSLMACGMERAKSSPGLVLWDIESAAPILGFETRPLPSLNSAMPRFSLQKTGDARIIQPLGMAEGVSSLSFLAGSSRLLAAAVSNRWLRLYDLRASTAVAAALASGSAPRQGSNKGIVELAVDPLDPLRVATFGDDSVVRIWDHRALNFPVLNFSHRDAWGDGAGSRTTYPIASVAFSPTQRGVFATLESEKNSVRFWDLVDGRRVPSDHDVSPDASDSGSRRHNGSGWRWATDDRDSLAPGYSADDQRSNFHLGGTHKSRAFSRNLASFTFVPGTQSSDYVVGVSSDGDIEFSLTPKPHLFTWSSRGELGLELERRWRVYQPLCDPSVAAYHAGSVSGEHSVRVNGHNMATPGKSSPVVFGRGDPEGFPTLTTDIRLRSHSRVGSIGNGHTNPNTPSGVLQGLMPAVYSPAFKNIPMERSPAGRPPADMTPRPAPSPALPSTSSGEDLQRLALFKPQSSAGRRKASKSPVPPHTRAGSVTRSRVPSSQRGSVRVLRDDISVLMRRRVLQGYGLENFSMNGSIMKEDQMRGESMIALWKWMEQSRKLFPEDECMFFGYDFSFRGLLAIWEGFEASSFGDTPPVPPPSTQDSSSQSLLDGTSQSDSPTAVSNMSGQFWGGEAYPDIVARINESHGRSALALEKVMVPTGRLQQRRLALAVCGWEMDEERLDARIRDIAAAGDEARAACWLMFTNQHSKALEVLGNSKDERHRIMSGTLAALLPPNPDRKADKERLQTVSLRLEDPYMRIMLLYAAFADWDEVLLEGAVPLEERLAIAFCFLDDRTLTRYLRARADSYKNSPEIEGLMLTGISTREGISILDAYVDVVGDVQTAAILSSQVMCPPVDFDTHAHHSDDDKLLFQRAERWAEAYRGLLDSWHLFGHRCRFDIARGELLSQTQGVRGSSVDAPYPWVPAQLRIRCNTCKKLLDVGPEARSKGMQCPTCKKALPRCVICLLGLEVPPEDVRGTSSIGLGGPQDTVDQAFIFCQTCRHGGHASHVLEWFFGNSSTDEDGPGPKETHDVCAAGDCECRCADLF